MLLPMIAIGGVLLVPAAALLFATVFAAVHHAETIAHRLGDPYGAILLAVAVTVIEVALIVSILLNAPPGTSEIARDTVFAAIMIVLNGIVGLCLLIGGLRFREQEFQPRGATGALAVLGTVVVLTLVLPNYTLAVPGPVYAPPQLLFVAVVSLALYGLFLFVQMVRHQDHFRDGDPAIAAGAGHDASVTGGWWTMTVALVMLLLALLAVIGMAETLAPAVEHAVARAGLPAALVGVTIAMTVLLPEGTAAVRAAWGNRLQTSLNLALGSALASICLTIPVVALMSLALHQPLTLGLEAEHMVLLVLSLFMATLSLAMGRTTILQGGVHLVIFGAFLVLSAIP
ncbi:MAG: ionic transporter y4hA [Geminicoccaceae bacterium]|nr:MAG: ionic transporter y4hA [Geminicoccaceae bacterium]